MTNVPPPSSFVFGPPSGKQNPSVHFRDEGVLRGTTLVWQRHAVATLVVAVSGAPAAGCGTGARLCAPTITIGAPRRVRPVRASGAVSGFHSFPARWRLAYYSGSSLSLYRTSGQLSAPTLFAISYRRTTVRPYIIRYIVQADGCPPLHYLWTQRDSNPRPSQCH